MSEVQREPFAYIDNKQLREGLLKEDPELEILSDIEIIEQAQPSYMLWSLRARLWSLIDKREELLERYGQCDKLPLGEIRRGICSQSQLDRYLKNPFQKAFLGRPLKSAEDSIQDQARAAVARLWELISLPLYVDDKPDKHNSKIVFDSVKLVLDRAHGTAIQRSQTITRIERQQSAQTVESIDADIEMLEERLAETRPIIGEIETQSDAGEEASTEG